MRSKSYYKSQIRYNQTTRRKPSDGKRVDRDPQFIVDLIGQVRKLDDKVRRWQLEDGINWLLGLDLYIQDKAGTLSAPLTHWTFTKGDIIFVDLFGHFGEELTYEHPAIVLVNHTYGVVIAPMSSSCYSDGVDTHVNLDKNVTNQGGVKNNSGIKVEQLRYISKRRILVKHGRVTSPAKLKEIDEVIMKQLAEYTYDKLLEEIEKLNDEIDALALEIVGLSQEVDAKDAIIASLQTQTLANELALKEAEVSAKDIDISKRDDEIAALKSRIAELEEAK